MKRYKIKECKYPDQHGCRGCEYSQVPSLFDGGCKLLIKDQERGVKNDRRSKRSEESI